MASISNAPLQRFDHTSLVLISCGDDPLGKDFRAGFMTLVLYYGRRGSMIA
jgi:hypothetical protein